MVKLEYLPEGEVTHFPFAGKGGFTIPARRSEKSVAAVAGMSRDKGGASAVAGGLFKTLSMLKPKGIRVIAELV